MILLLIFAGQSFAEIVEPICDKVRFLTEVDWMVQLFPGSFVGV